MATLPLRKVAVDVSADSSSWESLSFAGLLSIQDLQPKSSTTNSTSQTKGHYKEFEFGSTASESAANNLKKNGLTDMSMSEGQLQLHAFLCQPKQFQAAHKPGSKVATRSNNKRSSNNKMDVKVSDKLNQKDRSQENKERAASSSSLGQKILLSFISPCREC